MTTQTNEYQAGPFSCRRRGERRKVKPAGAKCWSKKKQPSQVVVIEADTKGARLILPWPVSKGQDITVSFSNNLGLYRTEHARIAWTQKLDSSGRTIVGLYYCPREAQAA